MTLGDTSNPLQPVKDFLNMVRHFRWWIGLGTLGLTLVSFTVIAVQRDEYKATTSILVDPQKIPERYVASTVGADLNQRLNAISQEVLSATRLQEIIERLNLYPSVREKMGREEIIDLMRKNITIGVVQGAGTGLSTFTITYVGSSPGQVAQVANQLASRFIEWNLETREQQAVGTTEFLRSQLDQAKQSLEEQEKKLREYKMAHVGELPDQQVANLQVLSQLQATFQANSEALNRLDVQRTMLLRSERSGTGSAPLTERGRLEAEKRQLEQKIFNLRRTYTANFPEVVEANQGLDRIKAQLKALPPDPDPGTTDKTSNTDDVQLIVLDREKKRLEEAQKRLLAQIHAYQLKVEAAPLRESQIMELTRNYDVSKNNYQGLLDKNFSAQMAADLEKKQKAERFTVLDPARPPEKPFRPNRRVLMFGAFLGSLALCLGAAFAKEMLDPSVKTETEVKSLLPAAVPLLVAIPTIETPVDRRRRLLFAAVAVATSLVACLLEAGFLWKVHPHL